LRPRVKLDSKVELPRISWRSDPLRKIDRWENHKPYPREVRERAVRMVLEHAHEHESQWAAINAIAEKFGMTAETLRKWVRRAEIDGGKRPG
jgi:transposase-like protein